MHQLTKINMYLHNCSLHYRKTDIFVKALFLIKIIFNSMFWSKTGKRKQQKSQKVVRGKKKGGGKKKRNKIRLFPDISVLIGFVKIYARHCISFQTIVCATFRIQKGIYIMKMFLQGNLYIHLKWE